MEQELIAISSPQLFARISPLGAELWSLCDADGRELMTDADPRWWTGHAPLLFPIVGRLNGGRYRIGGEEHELPQHGFARRRDFALTQRDAMSATFRLDADADTLAAYPFRFRLDMAFALDGATLAMTATVGNRGDADMPFSFGYHPAFAWPLPYGAPAEDHRIVFERDERAPLRRIGEDGLIAPEPRETLVQGDTLYPSHAIFEGDALIWDDLASRRLTWGAPGAPQLAIAFPDTPWLGLWQKPGARYLCIEPWAGMADPMGFVGEIWDKPGIQRLAPGERRAFRMDVTLTGDQLSSV